VVLVEGELDAMGRQKYDHSVTVDLRYLTGVSTEAEALNKMTPYLKSKGWAYKFWQRRHAMERMICRPCMREVELMERDWRTKRDGERRANTESFYGELCS
jgi:hypothetical protein